MVNHVVLDNNTHSKLKIIRGYDQDYGDNVGYTTVFPVEYRQCQAHYPIVFRKNSETGQFESVALFGFQQDENLFLQNNEWAASYIPLTIVRKPFLIGVAAGAAQNAKIHIDMDSPRVNYEKGEEVFLEMGGHSSYLKYIQSVLADIFGGVDESRAFVFALTEYELLEPFTLSVELNNGASFVMDGFYTINEDRLARLTGQELGVLHAKGYVEWIYLIFASLSHLKILIDKKNNLR